MDVKWQGRGYSQGKCLPPLRASHRFRYLFMMPTSGCAAWFYGMAPSLRAVNKYSFSGSVLNSGLSAVLWNELLHLCNGTICSNYVNDWKYVWTRFITTTPHILTVRTMWVAIRDFQPIWRLANLSISQHVFVLLLFALIRWWLHWPLVKLRIIGEKNEFPLNRALALPTTATK